MNIKAGGRAQPTFSNTTGGGTVLTWLEFDTELEQHGQYDSSKAGKLATHLTTSKGATILPVFSVADPAAAHGELQIFQNVPPGAATAHVDGETWQDDSASVAVVAGEVATTTEPLHVIPAGIVTARLLLPQGPVSPMLAVKQSCAGFDPVAPATFTAYRCATPVADIAKTDLSPCAAMTKDVPLSEQPQATFSRLPMGSYIIEARHPTLGRIREKVDVLPNTQTTVDLTSRAFPIFGRITRAGKPVRAEARFLGGSSHATTIVTREDGRFQSVLPAPPGEGRVEVIGCDGSFEYRYAPEGRIPPNVALEIDVPGASIEVTVRGAASGETINDAIVYAYEVPAEPNAPPRNRLRAVTNEEGVARFGAVDPPSTKQRVCAFAPPQGYLAQHCTDFTLAKTEEKKVELKLPKEGVVRGKLITSEPFQPALLFLATGQGVVKERITVGDDGAFWLREKPGAADYFALTGPGRPLYVLSTWSVEGDHLVLSVPQQRTRSIVIRGSNPEANRMLAVSIGGRRVPHQVLQIHLMNLRVDPGSPWTAGRTLPLIAENGVIAITLGPPLQEVEALGASGPEVFDRPEFANRLPTRLVPPDRDEVVFP
ncbi:MAG: hypothetical protein JJE51_10060 [Thermoanaerobaculia bacterium]|nr:hypothetical protein [Thermoanaerobaculia bacterium]